MVLLFFVTFVPLINDFSLESLMLLGSWTKSLGGLGGGDAPWGAEGDDLGIVTSGKVELSPDVITSLTLTYKCFSFNLMLKTVPSTFCNPTLQSYNQYFDFVSL